MGKGFDRFMQNPYYRDMYENAPTDRVREYYRITFDISPFVEGSEYGNEKLIKRAMELSMEMTREEVEYMAQFAAHGHEKSVFKNWIASIK